MDGINKGLKSVFIYSFIAIFIITTFFIVYYSTNDYSNKFVISINDTELLARYDTEYVKFIFKRFSGGTYNKSVSNNSMLFNKIKTCDKYILNIEEYEAYNRFSHREEYKSTTNQELKEVFDNNKTMMVQKDNKIIYEGKFLNDITSIIKENGRYYFHVYTKQKGNSSPFGYSKTSLHFNFLVGDDYE